MILLLKVRHVVIGIEINGFLLMRFYVNLAGSRAVSNACHSGTASGFRIFSPRFCLLVVSGASLRTP